MSSTDLNIASTSAEGSTAYGYRPIQPIDAQSLAQLLRGPLTVDDITPRLLGHWGTTQGLNFLYAHLNRVIRSGGWARTACDNCSGSSRSPAASRAVRPGVHP